MPFAERAALSPAVLLDIPANWSAAEAAAFPVNFLTAYFAYYMADVKPGDRVCLHYLLTCGECVYCSSGQEQFCVRGAMLGKHANGGYAEYAVARADFVVPIPAAMDDLGAAPLLCGAVVEVKGGQVGLDGRQWTQSDAHGVRRIHPVDQARVCKYLLRDYLAAHHGQAYGLLRAWGDAVAAYKADPPAGQAIIEKAIGAPTVFSASLTACATDFVGSIT